MLVATVASWAAAAAPRRYDAAGKARFRKSRYVAAAERHGKVKWRREICTTRFEPRVTPHMPAAGLALTGKGLGAVQWPRWIGASRSQRDRTSRCRTPATPIRVAKSLGPFRLQAPLSLAWGIRFGRVLMPARDEFSAATIQRMRLRVALR
jgi:hypothetical protein